MKKGIILINAYTQNPGVHFQAKRLSEEFACLSADVSVVRNNTFIAHIDGGNTSVCGGADFVVLLDKDKYIPRMLEKKGIRVFNSSAAVELCDDKMLTHIALADSGTDMPKTLAGPLCYTPGTLVDDSYCDSIIQKLGLPLIMKLSYGSMGNEVFLIETKARLKKMANKFIAKPHLYQTYISSSRGEDMRVIVIGGKVCAAMLRRSKADFRSNIEQGAQGYRAQLSPDYIEMSERAAKILGLDYCGIDILRGPGGSPVLCEVNSNAFFTGIESVSGVNVAGLYARHILQSIGNN